MLGTVGRPPSKYQFTVAGTRMDGWILVFDF